MLTYSLEALPTVESRSFWEAPCRRRYPLWTAGSEINSPGDSSPGTRPSRLGARSSDAIGVPAGESRKLRIALVADGPPTDHHTNSGVAYGMFEALKAHSAVDTVIPINASFTGLRKILVALYAIDLSESAWRVKYSQGWLAVRTRSSLVRRQVRRLGTDIDVVLIIRGLYEPFPFPYVMFIDSTVALTQAGWPPMAPSRGAHSWSPRADRAQLHAAEHVFTAGRHVAEHAARDYDIPAERVTAVGGGLNYPLSTVPRRAPSPRPTVLFVGHDFHRKGGDVLVKAFDRVRRTIPDARLVLVGRGTPVELNRPGITSLGEIDDRHQLSELYREATAFCLPARFEPYGLVLLEAMAHGVPCVATRAGAIPEILQDGRLGLLVDIEDVNGLADGLINLLLDVELQEALAAEGRREVEVNGTWTAVADRLMQILIRI